jgi:hypothetical protein
MSLQVIRAIAYFPVVRVRTSADTNGDLGFNMWGVIVD